MFMGCSLTCIIASFENKTHYFSHIYLYSTPARSVPSPINALLSPGFMKPLPQKYAMGSDWLAGPQCVVIS